jgi:CheY-like chemotaxis protein
MRRHGLSAGRGRRAWARRSPGSEAAGGRSAPSDVGGYYSLEVARYCRRRCRSVSEDVRRLRRRRRGEAPMTAPAHILVVDDDPAVRALVAHCIEDAGYRVTAVGEGERGAEVAAGEDVRLAILDIGLPGIDGLSLTRELRVLTDIGIIILSGRGETTDRIIGLEIGADDYLAKPFDARARSKGAQRPAPAAGADGREGAATGGQLAPGLPLRPVDPRSGAAQRHLRGGGDGGSHLRGVRPARNLRRASQSGAQPQPAHGLSPRHPDAGVRPQHRRAHPPAAAEDRGQPRTRRS